MAGLNDFREFAAWQRAEELRVMCEEFLSRPGIRQRFRRAQQLDDAAASAPRNIAEGFGRFKPRVFAQFVSIAKGSETEVMNILLEARSANFLTAAEFLEFETAARRAIGTAVGLIRYLQRSDGPRNLS
jgi:four helix bundle protein